MTKERPHLGWVRFITILAGFFTVLAILSTWVDRQVFDTQEWGDTSLKLLQNPEIQQQVATYAVDELYANVDVQGELAKGLDELNSNLGDTLAGPLAGAARQGADNLALRALENDKVQSAWQSANIAAHQTLIDVIEDKGEFTSTSEGQVELKLKPLIIEIADQVGLGDQARDKIPDSVGNVKIVESKELSQVQTVAQLIHGLALVSGLLALVLIALAVWLSPGYRWLTLFWLSVALILAALIVLVLRSVAGNVLVPELADPDIQPAAHAAWDIATELLKSVAWGVIWLAVVLLVVAWVIAPTKPSGKVREFLAVPFGQYPAATFSLLGLAAFIFLIMGAGDGREFLIRLVIVLMAGAGFWFFRRQIMLEFPDADYSGLREFGERTRDKAKNAWAGRPKNIQMPKLGGKDGDGGAPGGASQPEAETAVLGSTPAASEESRLDQLEKLGKLKDAGILDDEEFAAEKKRILGGD
ncbi:MAG: SHOCT domain-containing protein [Solirubrobacterales bacterium]|nr:SHOCT domain-containing protein [Solirubrobacterales bacterium]